WSFLRGAVTGPAEGRETHSRHRKETARLMNPIVSSFIGHSVPVGIALGGLRPDFKLAANPKTKAFRPAAGKFDDVFLKVLYRQRAGQDPLNPRGAGPQNIVVLNAHRISYVERH